MFQTVRKLSLLSLVLLLLVGCSEKIELLYPGDPIPVLFAIFDQQDSTHYIRISQSFAGEESVYQTMRQKEQLYDPTVSVSLRPPNGNLKYLFTRLEDQGRVSGLFPEQPLQYHALQLVLTEDKYLVEIESDQHNPLSIPVKLIQPFKPHSPVPSSNRFYFYDDPTVFSFTPPEGSGVFEIAFVLYYEEHLDNGSQQMKSYRYSYLLFPEQLEWELDHFNHRFYADPFYAHIGSHLEADAGVDYRKPMRLDLELTAGDSVLARYLDWQEQELDAQINPQGNVDGAIGFVASKYTYYKPNLKFSKRAQDSLIYGRFTKDLQFVANSNW